MKILLLLCLFVFACTEEMKRGKTVDRGVLKNGSYENKYFDFELAVPANWKDQTDAVYHNLKNRTGADSLGQIPLIMLSKIKKDSNGYNPSFLAVAEKIEDSKRIKSGKDYLQYTKGQLELSPTTYRLPDQISSRDIGGKEFYLMETSIDYFDKNIIQNYYARVDGDYVLAFMETYLQNEGRKELDEILTSVKFRN